MFRQKATTQTIALLEHQNLWIITNNFNIALPACTRPTFEATVAGRRLREKHRNAMDIGIYGLAGVDNDGTLLDFNQE